MRNDIFHEAGELDSLRDPKFSAQVAKKLLIRPQSAATQAPGPRAEKRQGFKQGRVILLPGKPSDRQDKRHVTVFAIDEIRHHLVTDVLIIQEHRLLGKGRMISPSFEMPDLDKTIIRYACRNMNLYARIRDVLFHGAIHDFRIGLVIFGRKIPS